MRLKEGQRVEVAIEKDNHGHEHISWQQGTYIGRMANWQCFHIVRLDENEVLHGFTSDEVRPIHGS